MSVDTLFNLKNLRCCYDKNYQEGASKVVLEIEDLEIPRGKIVFIVGESGIGKSTILETLGLMNDTVVRGDKGTVFTFASGADLIKLWDTNNDSLLSDFRRKYYSFIFQSTNLMRNFTAVENIIFTRMLQGYDKNECLVKAHKILAQLGMEHVDDKRMANELSGGQQQRLAFARAVIPDFEVLFGDEPTGNLDSVNAFKAMGILSDELKEREGSSAIIVSHDMQLAITYGDVIIKIRKESRPRKSSDDEEQFYGVLDKSCVFLKNNEMWTNGNEVFTSDDFLQYLRTQVYKK